MLQETDFSRDLGNCGVAKKGAYPSETHRKRVKTSRKMVRASLREESKDPKSGSCQRPRPTRARKPKNEIERESPAAHRP